MKKSFVAKNLEMTLPNKLSNFFGELSLQLSSYNIIHFLFSHNVQMMQRTNIWFCNGNKVPKTKKQPSTLGFSKINKRKKKEYIYTSQKF